MPVSPTLLRKLQETLGRDAAEDLVTWMQASDAERGGSRAGFAKVDERFAELRHDVDERFAELRHEMQAGFGRADGRINDLRTEMQVGFAKVDARIAQSETRIEALVERRVGDLMKWSFVFWCGAVAAVAALAGVLRSP